ncbi:hypothetical protein [Streptomyces roseolilacinus]|uniref:Uncharacterized protein n=1 Tax=Streptomyces roseolilacinus TaxID=66904 RepID=A0A918B1S8_9ACTN|nr:hypothetical protein [Streptomyces roseolilacinus]GGQ07044.1 hypothetical protein GCM10010249_26600 [Streptomyces roseolilacinus]
MNSQFADPSTTQINAMREVDVERADAAVFEIEIEEVEMLPTLLKQGCIC